MLESMKKSARPTRAEVSDVANAVLDGTDAVMLSGETTVGKYPVEVVTYMAQICKDTEEYYDYDYEFDSEREVNITETIANSVVNAASVLGIDLIIASTVSGDTARRISNLKPRCLVLAATNSEAVARSLALNYAVYPTIVPSSDSTDEVIAIAAMKKQKAKYEEALQCPVAYEVALNSVSMRNALVKSGVPFVDLPGNVFLPFMGIVLQDVYRKQLVKADKMMPATQILDQEVVDYVMNSAQSQELLKRMEGLLEYSLPLYVQEGKSQLMIAVGCTGGKHRSITFARKIAEYCDALGGTRSPDM